jgi:valyl-tRNA synthetase
MFKIKQEKVKTLDEELKKEVELLSGFVKNTRNIFRNHNFFIKTKRILKMCEKMENENKKQSFHKIRHFIIQVGDVNTSFK